MKSVIVILACLLLAVGAKAATYTATGIGYEDVLAAYNLTSSGDTIIVPAGSGATNWIKRLILRHNVIIRGPGPPSLYITNNVPIVAGQGTNQWQSLIEAYWTDPGQPRISGFTIVGGASGGQSHGQIYMNGTNNSTRIDHMGFLNCPDRNIFIEGTIWGSIDNCTFTNNANETAILDFWATPSEVARTGGSGEGDLSWEQPDWIGTTNTVVIEDNIFSSSYGTIGGGATDMYQGSRYTFRHNLVVHDSVQTHGTESGLGYRGQHIYQIYNNDFWNPGGNYVNAMYLRGGTGLVVSNNCHGTGYNNVMNMVCLRTADWFNTWGGVTGINPWDSNDPAIYYTGAQTGLTPNDSKLTDGTASFVASMIGLQLVNISAPGTGNYGYPFNEITSETPTTLSYSAKQYSQTSNLVWNVTDIYRVYKCLIPLDNIGVSATAPGYHMNRANAMYTGQVYDPVLISSNLVNNVLTGGKSKSGTIAKGSNWIDNANMAGVTFLQYPGPLNQPAFYTNLTLSFSPSPAYVNQLVTGVSAIQTNNVTDSSLITGTIELITNNVAVVNQLISSGQCTYSQIFGFGVGAKFGTYAAYTFAGGTGNAFYNTLTSSIVTFQVLKYPTTSSAIVTSGSPSTVGNPVTFTYTLKTNTPSVNTAVPTDAGGTMAIIADGNTGSPLVSGPPVNGVISVTTSALTVGVHAITGTYTGDSTYAASSFSGLSQTVNASAAAATTTTITSDINPSVSPRIVTFSSEVHKVSDGTLAANATGQITFEINGNVWTVSNVSGGIATFNSSALPCVNDVVQAIYTGDVNYNGSSSTNYLQLNFNGPARRVAPTRVN